MARLLVVASAGGHLLEALIATEGLPVELIVATNRLPMRQAPSEAARVYFLLDPHANLLKYVVNGLQACWLICTERPDVMLTTGAGIAIAAALLSKLVGAKLIVIETAACVCTPSRTGRFLYKFSDLFLVQWPELLRHYPRAIVAGTVI